VENRELYIEELIAKQLSGESTPEENAMLEKWLAAHPDNRSYYNSLQILYQESAAAESVLHVDTDAAWNKLREQIAEKKTVKADSARSVSWLRIAALALLVAGAGAALYIMKMRDSGEERHYITFNASSLFTLPDSSSIFLNKNSEATVIFKKHQRTVQLRGEGFFTVTHNEKQPFIVEAAGLQIKDIGTAFNVDATDGKHVDVIVEQGEVELAAEGKTMHLKKGAHSIYDNTSHSIINIPLTDPNALSYTTRIFVFENTSLPAVIVKLHEVYGTDIALADNLKFCRLTSTFRNEKIENILQVIAETLQLRLDKKGAAYYFEGSGCSE
jgi:transmembrane sensor